jgi:hypothetical protein
MGRLGALALGFLAVACGESSGSSPGGHDAGGAGSAGTAGSIGGASAGQSGKAGNTPGGGRAGASAGGAAGAVTNAGAAGDGGSNAGAAGDDGLNAGGAGTAGAGGQGVAGDRGGEGGDSAAGGAEDAGGAGAGTCPAQQPSPGTCAPSGLTCAYESGCCTSTFTCNAGTWFISSLCTPVECPPSAPASGSACDACANRELCRYGNCANTGETTTTATCAEDETWQVETLECAPFPCGSTQCEADQLCVSNQSRCVDNPCEGQALSCECAQSACGEPSTGYVCSGVSDRSILCTCLTC